MSDDFLMTLSLLFGMIDNCPFQVFFFSRIKLVDLHDQSVKLKQRTIHLRID